MPASSDPTTAGLQQQTAQPVAPSGGAGDNAMMIQQLGESGVHNPSNIGKAGSDGAAGIRY